MALELDRLGLLEVCINSFPDLLENLTFVLARIDLDDLGVRKVGGEEIGFAVIVLEILFDLFGFLTFKPLSNHVVTQLELENQRLLQTSLGTDFNQEVTVVLRRRIAVQQQTLADVRLFQAL